MVYHVGLQAYAAFRMVGSSIGNGLRQIGLRKTGLRKQAYRKATEPH